MNEKLQNLTNSLSELSNAGIQDIGILGFILIMALSLISSFLVAILYLKFYGSRATGSQIHRAFPLLGMSVTAIFTCIQFSLPLSLGLLGALSIVRFRTPIKEPEEIGFIMLIIGTSIAVSTFSLYFLIILLGFAALALFIQNQGLKFISSPLTDGMLIMTIDNDIYQAQQITIDELLNKNLIKHKLESISKSENGSIVTISFRGLNSKSPINLQTSIEELLQPSNLNIYFNKQSTL